MIPGRATGVYAPARLDIRGSVTIAVDPTRVPAQRRGHRLSDLADTRRRTGYRLWQVLTVALLTLVGAWDVLGLLVGGDAAYASRSYDVLRLAPFGMRTYGVALGLLMIVTVYAYGRHRGGDHRLLQVALSLLAAWYVFWLVAIAGTWVIHREVLAWGAVGKLAFTASVAYVLARATPHAPPGKGAAGVAGPRRSRR